MLDRDSIIPAPPPITGVSRDHTLETLLNNQTMNKFCIEEKKCVTVEKTWHFKINLNDDMYFFIAQTIQINDKDEVVSIKRGSTYYDCQKRLKTSEKKLITRTINSYF